MTDLPTPELLRKLLRYAPETGLLYWRERTPDMFREGCGIYTQERNCKVWNARFSEKEAFTGNTHDYKRGGIFNKMYRAHRVIWAMETGAWPVDQIDHINHDKTDNRIKNLRVVTNQENTKNQAMNSNNTSGHNGVCWAKRNNKWQAMIGVDGIRKYLGLFDDISDAIAVRAAAEIKYGFHKNHGKQL